MHKLIMFRKYFSFLTFQPNVSGNIYDGMKNYQPVFRERESFSSLTGNIFGETKPAPSTMSKIKEQGKNFHKKTFLL